MALTHYDGFVSADPSKYITQKPSTGLRDYGGTPITENPVYINQVNIQLPPGTPDQHVQIITDRFKQMQKETTQEVSQAVAGLFY